MRLFELFDNPLEYRLMNTSTNVNRGEKDYQYGFKLGDYWYKVYISLFPMSTYEEKDIEGNEIKFPWQFHDAARYNKLVMSVDFGQFDYGEKSGIPMRGTIPIGVGDERQGREGTGNEFQVFATVAAIAQEVFNKYKDDVGAIEYGANQNDPNRKRMYDTMMRKFGISGQRAEYVDHADNDGKQTRVLIVL